MKNTCDWKDTEEGWAETECGEAFVNEGDVVSNNHWIKFCIYCGKPVQLIPFTKSTTDEA